MFRLNILLRDFSVIYFKDLIVEGTASQDLVQMVTVGVRDEDLSEGIARYQSHDLLHPFCIQFVENIVQQQQGCRLGCRPFQEVELGEFQGNGIRLVLSL